MVRRKNAIREGRQIGAALRARRKELRITQTRLARAIGVSYQQIQKYENGSNEIPAGRFAALARALRVRASFFFGAVPGANQPGSAHTVLALLRVPGATELLECYVKMPSPARRRRFLSLVRSLAESKAERPSASD